MDVSRLTGALASLNKSAVSMDIAIETFRQQVKADRAVVGLIEASVEAAKAANATGQLVDITV
ncbi:MAG: hypothetical protein ACOVKO_08845 [Elstera sp.]